MKIINVRLLLILVTLGIVFTIVVYFVHDAQVNRHASFYLKRAHAAKEDPNKILTTIKNYNQYLVLRPNDTDALAEFGMLLADVGQYQAAISKLEAVLRHDPERSDARRALIKPLLLYRRLRDVKEHLNLFLLKESPDDAELLEYLGVCQVLDDDTRKAIVTFEKSVASDPTRLTAYARLTATLHQLKRTDEADKWMVKLIAANPDSFEAYLLRGDYYKKHKKLDDAVKDGATALKLAPDEHNVLLFVARCDLQKGNYDVARKTVERGLKLFPHSVPLYAALSNIEVKSGHRKQAIKCLTGGLVKTNNNTQLLWNMANLLIDQRDLDRAQAMVAKLRAANYPKTFADYLDARIAFAKRQWLLASKGFEKVRPGLTAVPSLVKQIDYWLGECYKQLGNADMQLAAYRRATSVDRLWNPGRLGVASALLSIGRLDEALEEYKQIMRTADAPPSGLIQMAQLMVLQNLRRPERQRNWAEVNRILEIAGKANPDSTNIPILRAEVLIAQNKPEEAKKLLVKERDKNPKQLAYWSALMSLAQRDEDWDSAEKLLAGAAKQFGNTLALRLVRAQYLLTRYGQKAAKQLKQLADDTKGLSKAERLHLWRNLAKLSLQAQDFKQSRTLCIKVGEEEPTNLQIRLLLFELCLRAKDNSTMEQALSEIKQIEGKGPLWLYGQAIRLSLLAESNTDPHLDQAIKYLEAARIKRSAWGRAPLMIAQIRDRQGKTEVAIKEYTNAIELGIRNPMIIQRLAQLLYQQQRYAEADRILRLLEERDVTLSPDLVKIGAQIKLQLGNFGQALHLARQVAKTSKNYRDHIWLGQILGVMGQRAMAAGQTTASKKMFDDAKKSLQRAVELDDKTPETWVALIQFLGRTQDMAAAEKAIADAEKKIPAEHAALALAQCYEAIGQTEAAEKQYQAALSAAPESSTVARALATFYLRTGRTKLAEAQLKRISSRKVEATEAEVNWGRRRLAFLLSARGGYKNRHEALALIEQNLATAGANLQDQRAKAMMLASRSKRRQRREAIETLESLVVDQHNTKAEDRFVLAQLYLAENNWAKASRQMRTLLAAHGRDPRYVAAYIKALLKRHELGEANRWLGRLTEIAPNNLTTIKLQIQYAIEQKQFKRAMAILTSYIDNSKSIPTDRTVRLAIAADLASTVANNLKAVKQKDAATEFIRKAESLYREYVKKQPSQQLLFASFLARQGQIDAALEVINKSWKESQPTKVAATCVAMLGVGAANAGQSKQIEKILTEALEKFERPVSLQLAMAELYSYQERYEDAEAIYRSILAKDSNNIVALNNLSVFLALRRVKLSEALELVNRAIDISGPVSTLLDSRGTVFLALGKSKNALADLKESIEDKPSAARFFHLAQAYLAAGNYTKAEEALEKATDLGLRPENLQPLERPAYRHLVNELK